MKKLLLILITSICIFSCGTTKTISTTTNTETHIVDSVAWHDSTVVTYITKERYRDIVNINDTLNLETDYAKAKAYIDTTTSTLKGEIENKDTTPVKTNIKWKEKIVYKDSIQIKEVEVPVEVEIVKTKYPTTYWIFLGITLLVVIYIGIKIYLKIKI